MAIMNEFRDFAARGNVVEMGTGIAIGLAFTSVVNSFVSDILNPLVSLFTGGIDLTNLFINLGDGDYATLAEARKAGVPTLNYGVFLDNLLTFLIAATVIFIIVKQYNRLDRTLDALRKSRVMGDARDEVLAEIRDLLGRGDNSK